MIHTLLGFYLGCSLMDHDQLGEVGHHDLSDFDLDLWGPFIGIGEDHLSLNKVVLTDRFCCPESKPAGLKIAERG